MNPWARYGSAAEIEARLQHYDPKKCCRCGRIYSGHEYFRLPYPRGGSEMPEEDGIRLEMRQCECGGTMGIEIMLDEETSE